ncbi:hypothetical protein K466DRAFT_272822 [Polyporus arcularius HHB13444]|uniref:PH domain-containing protein n=1 Tax=Polyporus arcularius HHB13444 TaxID=1314778 RepID=A0A5C3P0F3_9APHY|nr:hypothetical protein K466DRAFT_272822 [Polyporus arcularius HHB13444]
MRPEELIILDDQTFQLVVAYPRGGDSVGLRASSVRECQTWMEAIYNASKRCREVQRRTTGRSRG